MASTALPGAWPCALMTARFGSSSSAIVMSTTNRALMKPTPTFALARKWVSSMTSIDSTPGPHGPDLVRVDDEGPHLVAGRLDVDGAGELHRASSLIACWLVVPKQCGAPPGSLEHRHGERACPSDASLTDAIVAGQEAQG